MGLESGSKSRARIQVVKPTARSSHPAFEWKQCPDATPHEKRELSSLFPGGAEELRAPSGPARDRPLPCKARLWGGAARVASTASTKKAPQAPRVQGRGCGFRPAPAGHGDQAAARPDESSLVSAHV